ncbi:hypothetical protein [Clostridium ljungdahlii]
MIESMEFLSPDLAFLTSSSMVTTAFLFDYTGKRAVIDHFLT